MNKLYDYLKQQKHYVLDKYEDLFRNPPHFDECQKLVDEYVSIIRPMQDIVKEEAYLEVRLTECDGAEHVFKVDSWSELCNWGVNKSNSDYLLNSGHVQATVDKAFFHSRYKNRNSWKELLEIQSGLIEKHKPIIDFYTKTEDYGHKLDQIGFFLEVFPECLHAENSRQIDLQEEYREGTYHVNKGLLSISFVYSLMSHLKPDLVKYHPGD